MKWCVVIHGMRVQVYACMCVHVYVRGNEGICVNGEYVDISI